LGGELTGRPGGRGGGGPPGVRGRVGAAMEVFFPGSSRVDRRFAVEFVDLREGTSTLAGPAGVTPFIVNHASGAPAYALRVEYGGEGVADSGGTERNASFGEGPPGAGPLGRQAGLLRKKDK